MDENQKYQNQLQSFREQIDQTDRQILDLLATRASLAKNTGEVKRLLQLEEFYQPQREKQVIEKLQNANKSILNDQQIAIIFKEIMSACLSIQKDETILYLGPKGTYTQLAAIKHFGKSLNFVPYKTVEDIFKSLSSNEGNFGVVAIENSTEGMITHTIDLFSKYQLLICGEVELEIHHYLLINPESSIDQIKTVTGHQTALAQCSHWLKIHLPEAKLKAVDSNALGGDMASQDKSIAAIGSQVLESLYDLKIYDRNIENYESNTTRFLIIGKKAPSKNLEHKDKTTILIAGENKVGLLYNILKVLNDNKIDMTRLESRPNNQTGLNETSWQYYFYIDFLGHIEDEKVKTALDILKEQKYKIKLLGSYPTTI